MDFIQTISIPSIVATVYCVMYILKSAFNNNKFNTFIPLIAAIVGSGFGVLLYLGFPEVIPAKNIFSAIIIGAASGWAATGANQTFKKISKMNDGGDKNGS